MEISIDRSLPITITEQIKGKIAYEIMCGKLAPGVSLPSVRELSAKLSVAPMTVTRVYRELAQEHLIVTRPGVGTFVADITDASLKQGEQSTRRNLHQVVHKSIQQALALGYTAQEVRHAVLQCLERHYLNETVAHIALVGNFRLATEAYARQVENTLKDLNVKVQTVLRSELQADLEDVLERFKGVRVVITIPTRLQEIRCLLEPYDYTVVAVAFQVSSETRHKVSSIPPTSRVGVVATYPEFLNSLLEGVVSFGLLETTPLSAYIDQQECVKDMLRQVDVVIYASGSERILEWLPNGVAAFEYRHVPDPASLNRLRPLIAQWTAN